MHWVRFFPFILLLCPGLLLGQFPNNLEGDWSGAWDFNNPLTDRGAVRATTVQAGATGTRDFLFNNGPMDYVPEFKLDLALSATNPQTLNTRHLNILQNSGNNIQFPATNGNWYTFIVEEAGNSNDLAILETSFQPVNIDSAFRCPRKPNDTVSVAVSVTLSAALHAGEEVWLRYSVDSFASSTFVQLSGNPLSASIPALPHGTTVQYYFLTTLNSLTLNHADADYQSLTVRYQGLNPFFYTVDSLTGSDSLPCDIFPSQEYCGDGVDNDGDGLTDGFDLNDCGACLGQPGENVFPGGDFGSVAADGQNPVQPDPLANPGVTLGNPLPATVTTYAYGFSGTFACLNGVLCFPDDGNYVLATSTNGMINSPSASNNWIEIEDNGPEPDGYMMVVNAAPTPGIFYLQELSGLCPNSAYEVSFDVANLIAPGTQGAVFPNIDFVIGPGGADLNTMQGIPASANTGDVPQDSSWHSYSFTFIPSDTTVTLALRNNNPGGINNVGNDLAIDNIAFKPCGPTLTLTASATFFCPGTSIFLDGILGQGYMLPAFQWQYSSDSGQTWVDLSGANGPDLLLSNTTLADTGWYRLLVAEDGNLASPNCRIASDTLSLQEQCPLDAIDTPRDTLSRDAFGVYPNPSAGLFEVSLETGDLKKVEWAVFDFLGRRVARGFFFPREMGIQHIPLDLRGLSKGLYLLYLEAEQFTNKRVEKLIIR